MGEEGVEAEGGTVFDAVSTRGRVGEDGVEVIKGRRGRGG